MPGLHITWCTGNAFLTDRVHLDPGSHPVPLDLNFQAISCTLPSFSRPPVNHDFRFVVVVDDVGL